MREAMISLGYENEDLDTRKRKENFREDPEGGTRSPSKDPLAASKELKMQTFDVVNDELVKLRFKHYQDRLLDRINRVLQARKQIKMRKQARDSMQASKNHVFSMSSNMTPAGLASISTSTRPMFHQNKDMGSLQR